VLPRCSQGLRRRAGLFLQRRHMRRYEPVLHDDFPASSESSSSRISRRRTGCGAAPRCPPDPARPYGARGPASTFLLLAPWRASRASGAVAPVYSYSDIGTLASARRRPRPSAGRPAVTLVDGCAWNQRGGRVADRREVPSRRAWRCRARVVAVYWSAPNSTRACASFWPRADRVLQARSAPAAARRAASGSRHAIALAHVADPLYGAIVSGQRSSVITSGRSLEVVSGKRPVRRAHRHPTAGRSRGDQYCRSS